MTVHIKSFILSSTMASQATISTRNARNLPSGGPRSPTLPHRKQQVPPGFRPSVRPKQRPIAEMTIRELQDLRRLNTTILASPYAIPSFYPSPPTHHSIIVERQLPVTFKGYKLSKLLWNLGYLSSTEWKLSIRD